MFSGFLLYKQFLFAVFSEKKLNLRNPILKKSDRLNQTVFWLVQLEPDREILKSSFHFFVFWAENEILIHVSS